MSWNEGEALEDAFRPATQVEGAVLAALLGVSFAGRAELLDQIADLTVRRVDANGSLQLRGSGVPKAPVDRRVPVEAEFLDSDGMPVHLLLHVIDGALSELEIYREDSGTVLSAVGPGELSILVL
ncbi:hypothetical protein SAMN05444157_3080 [Frankineae bacterium MT45]|nr:hypothetical protein SAMN05444157_3080 [Frankineae bacterium MT45]